jgi:excisionase family DNA binding protein
MNAEAKTVQPSPGRLCYSVREVASMLGRSEQYVRQLIKDGVLQSRKLGGVILIPRSALKEIDSPIVEV